MTDMRRLDDPFRAMTPPLGEGFLEVGAGHRLYWLETGARDGVPMLSCHGGPGGAMMPGTGRFSDGARVRSILFDQRGCGRSEPRGRIEANSLQHTLADIEMLREHLGIEQWVVTGGSWGATIALAYAEAYPERCLGLFLVGVWLCRRRDMDWWFQGVRALFPELWESFAALVPENERGDLRRAYCRRILEGDPETAARFATSLYLYEEGFMHFDAPLQPADPSRGPDYGRIFAHYAANDFFVADDQLLQQAHRIAHLPVYLITGRYDCCTTPENAFDLSRVLPQAIIEIVPGAGHYPTEPTFARAVARAAQAFLKPFGA
jgi:proline iminopeptidase